jgi:RNA polymerase sigma factor (sigma-70 family)
MNRPPRLALLDQLIALGDPLRRALARRLNAADAEDCVQETAARLLEGRGESEVANPRAYLATVAQRVGIDGQRRRAREVSLEESAAQVLEQPDADPAQQVAKAQTRAALHAALAQLRGPARRALVLRYFHQMSHKEIGAAMGISPRTVEKHIAKGLAACREQLSALLRGGD